MRSTSRCLILATAGLGLVSTLGGCGTTPRDSALARRSVVHAGRTGDGRIAITPAARERSRTGSRTALGLSGR